MVHYVIEDHTKRIEEIRLVEVPALLAQSFILFVIKLTQIKVLENKMNKYKSKRSFRI